MTPPRSEPRTLCGHCGHAMHWHECGADADKTAPCRNDEATYVAEAAHPTAASADALRAALQRIVAEADNTDGDLRFALADIGGIARAALAATPPSAHPATCPCHALHDWPCRLEAGHDGECVPAHPATEGLDVERLAGVFFKTSVIGTMMYPAARHLAERIAGEYNRAGLSSPEGQEK